MDLRKLSLEELKTLIMSVRKDIVSVEFVTEDDLKEMLKQQDEEDRRMLKEVSLEAHQ